MSAIAALPSSAISQIGASQALTDSIAVVKELVENGLDARATAIFVEISTNFLDKIRVRDNGTGINPDDRSMICKRYCTSKIRNLDDLSNLGGVSLGFRGEALASIAELSTSLTVWTRIEGECAAALFEFDGPGVAKSTKRASSPVGTTIQISGFLHAYPVRRQSAEKSSTRSIGNLKRLWQSYVFARPQVRFCMKVLNPKDSNSDWTYVPKPIPSGENCLRPALFDALMKLYGKRVADQCSWISSSQTSISNYSHSESEENGSGQESTEGFLVQGIVIDARCTDLLPIANLGHFVSIDSRPMSCRNGALREITTYYKSCIRRSFSSSVLKRVTDPLLILHVTCPRGTYDVNIEPAKDDVLFSEPSGVIRLMKRFFNRIYGDPDIEDMSHVPADRRSETASFGGSLSKRPEIGTPNFMVSSGNEPIRGVHNSVSINAIGPMTQRDIKSSSRIWEGSLPLELVSSSESTCAESGTLQAETRHVNHDLLSPSRSHQSWMNEDYADHGFHDTEAPQIEQEASRIDDPRMEGRILNNGNMSNPWVFAKMDCTRRQPKESYACTQAQEIGYQFPTPARQKGDVINGVKISSPHRFQSSSDSEHCFPYPLTARRHRADEQEGIDQVSRETPASFQGDKSPLKNAGPPRPSTQLEQFPDSHPTLLDYFQSEMPPLFDPNTHESLATDPDLAITLDYESRKQKATHEHRKKLQGLKVARLSANTRAQIVDKSSNMGSESRDEGQKTVDSILKALHDPLSTNSPHRNRYEEAKLALQASSHSGSPRDLAMSQAKSTSDFKATTPEAPRHHGPPFSKPFLQGKKHKKPTLTRVAEEDLVLDLVLPVNAQLDEISEAMKTVGRWDEYINQDADLAPPDALVTTSEGSTEQEFAAAWKDRVHFLLEEHFYDLMKPNAGSSFESQRIEDLVQVEINFSI